MIIYAAERCIQGWLPHRNMFTELLSEPRVHVAPANLTSQSKIHLPTRFKVRKEPHLIPIAFVRRNLVN